MGLQYRPVVLALKTNELVSTDMISYRTAVAVMIVVVSVFLGTPFAGTGVGNAEERSEEGFVPLFDGKSLDGWHVMNAAEFVAEDGVLKLNGGLGWLRSDKQYSNFVLRLEFRFMKPKQDGGVFLRANPSGKPWPSQKYEVQIENTARMATIFGAEHELDVELTKKVLKPDEEWNEYEITLVGPKLEVRLNGKLVDKSEHAGKWTRGYLGLQAEHGFHEYRNFRIKELGE